MLFVDMVDQLRASINDYGDIDEDGKIIPGTQDFTDDRLSVLLVLAIRYLQTRLRIPKEKRIETLLEPNPYYVHPFVDIDDDFAELVILKAMCILHKDEVGGQFGSGNVTATLGPATIKTGEAAWGKIPKHIWDTTPCAELEKRLIELMAFDPRQLRAVYAVLPGVSGGRSGDMIENSRMQPLSGGNRPGDMIQ